MGSRAKLEDVPKVHELIQNQVRLLPIWYTIPCDSDRYVALDTETDHGEGHVEGRPTWARKCKRGQGGCEDGAKSIGRGSELEWST